MTKILILPDIHGRQFWKEAVEKHFNEVDKIIFLGDYLDRYENEGISRKEEIENFEEIIDFKKNNQDKVILLTGNHDFHYISPNFTRSTRYNSNKAYHIKEMFNSHKSFFKLAHEETINGKKILFTHAGLMNSWYDRNKNTIGDLTTENLNKLPSINMGVAVLGELSSYRSWIGEKSGSILWSDIREKIDKNSTEDNIIPNEDSIVEEYDYQIFGHTQLNMHPIITDKWVCLDCRRAFILNEKGKIENA